MLPSLLASSPQQIPSTALDSAFSSNVNSSQDSENVEMLGRRTLTQTTCLHIQIPQRCREAVEGIARYQINSTSIDRGVVLPNKTRGLSPTSHEPWIGCQVVHSPHWQM